MINRRLLTLTATLPLAALLFTACGGASCPEGFEKMDGRCLPADGGSDASPGDSGADADSCVATTVYRDDDGDGFGLAGDTMSSCDVPDGYAAEPGDCDDTDDAIHPGAEETCNGIDDDCDETLDEGLDSSTFYRDEDGDGFGTAGETLEACAAPEGWTDDDTDCDDTTDAVSPDADETCNDTDDDCDGATDEGLQGSVGALQQVTMDNGASGLSTASIVVAGDRYVAAWIAPGSIASQARFAELDAGGSVLGTGAAAVEPTSSKHQHRVRLAVVGEDTVVATWTEGDDGFAAEVSIRARLLDLAGGSHGAPVEVATRALAAAGPAVTVADDRIVFAWADYDGDGTGLIWVRTFDTGLAAPTSPIDLDEQTSAPLALAPAEGDPPYVLVAMVAQLDGDTEDHAYVDRVQLTPLGAELHPTRIDDVSPVRHLSAATTPRAGAERPMVGATITGDLGVELVRIEPGELGSTLTVTDRTTLSPAPDAAFNATAAAGGTFDGLVQFNPSSDIIGHFPVDPDGTAGERSTFGGSDFIASLGAARLSPSQGAALMVLERGSSDVWFQKLGCE